MTKEEICKHFHVYSIEGLYLTNNSGVYLQIIHEADTLAIVTEVNIKERSIREANYTYQQLAKEFDEENGVLYKTEFNRILKIITNASPNAIVEKRNMIEHIFSICNELHERVGEIPEGLKSWIAEASDSLEMILAKINNKDQINEDGSWK